MSNEFSLQISHMTNHLVERKGEKYQSSTSIRRRFVSENIPLCLNGLQEFCNNLTRDDLAAEDLVQSTCVRALERADQFEPGTQLDKWMACIARSIWSNELRRQSRHSSNLEADGLEGLACQINSVESNRYGSEIRSKICALPVEEMEAIRLVYVEEMSFNNAAELVGKSTGTLWNRVASARRKLSYLLAHA